MTVYCVGQAPINVPDDLDASILWPRWVEEAAETPDVVWSIVTARQNARSARWDAERKARREEAAAARLAALEAAAAAELVEETDPADWPAWTDADRWEPTEGFEPSAEDMAGLHVLFPDDDLAVDWDEFSRWAERVDAMAALAGVGPEHIARSVPGCIHESALI